MSRCFPFPPPGYEKKPKNSEHGDLLAKEKHKERKHKKDRKDREKREDKENKDRHRSKDKHEKKGKKEKHKDKNRDKDKSRTSEDRKSERRSEVQLEKTDSEVQHENAVGHDRWKAEEVRDYKFTKEFQRRITDEEQEAANRMVENCCTVAHKRIGGMGASNTTGKEIFIAKLQRKNEKLPLSYKKSTEGVETASTSEKQNAGSSKIVSAERRTENLTPPTHKRIESTDTAAAMEKKSSANNQKVGHFTSEKQNTASSGKVLGFNSAERRRTENRTSSAQKRIEIMGSTTAMEKQSTANNQKIGDFTSSDQRRNHVTGHPIDSNWSSVERKTDGVFTVDLVQKEKVASNNKMASNSVRPIKNFLSSCQGQPEGVFTVNSTQKENAASDERASDSVGAAANRDDGMDQPVEGFVSSVPERIKSMAATAALDMEILMVLNISETKKRTEGMELSMEKDGPMQKDTNKKTEGKQKTKQKKDEDGKRERHQDRDWKEKKRIEEKKEKRRENGDHKFYEHGESRENGIEDRIDNIIAETLVPYIENIKTDIADGNNRKRKEFEINGSHVGWPSKVPRTSGLSSQTSLENGRPVEFIHIASLGSNGAINNATTKGGMDNNGKHINGKMEVQPSHVLKGQPSHRASPIVVDSSKGDQQPSRPPNKADHLPMRPPSKSERLPLRPPHPDAKYLSTIYSIPEVDESLETDGQEWLFSKEDPRCNTKPKAEEAPQLWAKGVQVDSTDVFALPYVFPF